MASLQREEKHLILFLTMPRQDSSSVQRTRKRCAEVQRKVKISHRGGALATGAKVKIHQFQNEIDELLVTKTYNDIVAEELELLGEDVNRKERVGIGSTDAGNVSQVVPTIHPYIKIHQMI